MSTILEILDLIDRMNLEDVRILGTRCRKRSLQLQQEAIDADPYVYLIRREVMVRGRLCIGYMCSWQGQNPFYQKDNGNLRRFTTIEWAVKYIDYLEKYNTCGAMFTIESLLKTEWEKLPACEVTRRLEESCEQGI